MKSSTKGVIIFSTVLFFILMLWNYSDYIQKIKQPGIDFCKMIDNDPEIDSPQYPRLRLDLYKDAKDIYGIDCFEVNKR